MNYSGAFAAAVAAPPGGVKASRGRDVSATCAGHHSAALGPLTGDGADGVQTPPQEDAGDDQEQDAAGQPHAHGQFPASPVLTIAVLTQGVEHLTLVPHRIGSLTRHAQEVGGLGDQVGQVRAGLADRDALLVLETPALVAHQQAVPVRVVHDAVEGVQAPGGRRPAHSGGVGGNVEDRDAHDAGEWFFVIERQENIKE